MAARWRPEPEIELVPEANAGRRPRAQTAPHALRLGPEQKAGARARLKGTPSRQTKIGVVKPAQTGPPDPEKTPDCFIRLDEVRRRLAMGTSTVYSEMRRGRLHRPIRISARLAVWLESWIDEYQRARIAEYEANPDSPGLPVNHPNFRRRDR